MYVFGWRSGWLFWTNTFSRRASVGIGGGGNGGSGGGDSDGGGWGGEEVEEAAFTNSAFFYITFKIIHVNIHPQLPFLCNLA